MVSEIFNKFFASDDIYNYYKFYIPRESFVFSESYKSSILYKLGCFSKTDEDPFVLKVNKSTGQIFLGVLTHAQSVLECTCELRDSVCVGSNTKSLQFIRNYVDLGFKVLDINEIKDIFLRKYNIKIELSNVYDNLNKFVVKQSYLKNFDQSIFEVDHNGVCKNCKKD